MICPVCKSHNIKVLLTRTTYKNSSIRRRRKCKSCSFKFTTYEAVDRSYLKVLKRGGRTLEPFNKQKLLTGIIKSFANLDVPYEKQLQIADSIERSIYLLGKEVVKSADIGMEVLKNLKNTNQVAYIRFASVYYKFTNVTEFTNFINKLQV